MSLNVKASVVAELLRLSAVEKLGLAEWLRIQAMKQIEKGGQDHGKENNGGRTEEDSVNVF